MDDSAQTENESQKITLSLWNVIHDSNLNQIFSDAIERTITLVINIDYLREFAGFPAGFKWHFTLHSVSMLLARRWDVWPGPRPNLKGLTREKQDLLVSEYQTKGRTVSVAWNEFEQIVNSNGIWMKDATLHLNASGTIMDAYGHDNENDILFEFKLVGEQLRCEKSDGNKTTIEDLLRLGEEYWTAFSERKG